MFYYIKGKVEGKEPGFCVVDAGGIGYKIFTSENSKKEARSGEEVKFFCHLSVKEDSLDLYGFISIFELEVFEKLLTVSGIGPKTALAMLNISTVENLVSAINEGRPELLTRVSGIGKKTAERAILELKGKIIVKGAMEGVKKMESDASIEEALMSLGYNRSQVKEAISELDPKIKEFESRLKEALKNIAKK
ncbi:MAG: Holliday junction DNA helicase RuvA [Candidatus Liptonbacteria bacterium RIFOXYC1_FULL_36_8]|uniref:Holliday junction branch migration complex subunit RuvA n=3 Tax=Candidatus Liptoniibacteriota TaxID=1817909 RepID=A0A1G2CLW2_9BACT|nr:MAG: Holliday junction DNA helicase RuvA [Candidatus Liptonbacteria bacterium RIFOXYB1_FULL_36_10]OGZ02880.1 MAG: Holliday junction DNA helicase RuvA [Candidatus Liptonbacteria bacterium RIFOXYC1_FULL_36_8]OGZ03574.1 MAG: Holliday junction DNA helicase RuvA [Candidatus Liptonbacteria bacterium RIFOXYD1_FULL_36_11]